MHMVYKVAAKFSRQSSRFQVQAVRTRTLDDHVYWFGEGMGRGGF